MCRGKSHIEGCLRRKQEDLLKKQKKRLKKSQNILKIKYFALVLALAAFMMTSSSLLYGEKSEHSPFVIINIEKGENIYESIVTINDKNYKIDIKRSQLYKIFNGALILYREFIPRVI